MVDSNQQSLCFTVGSEEIRWLIEGGKGLSYMRCRVLTIAGVAAGLVTFGCAKQSEDATTAYVSPPSYEQLNCRQLAEDAVRVSKIATELSGVQDNKRADILGTTTNGIIVYWPTAFLVNGDDLQAAEYARLKNEFQAILQVSVKKGCSTIFKAAPN